MQCEHPDYNRDNRKQAVEQEKWPERVTQQISHKQDILCWLQLPAMHARPTTRNAGALSTLN